ncbi:MAG: flavodoxin family protein [Oscillospiraceae bacterium]|nr:flavodoxin family protein [Oscillospiraceae bacterium]
MKVLLINGSPHAQGCTYTALAEIAAELERQGVESQIFHIGSVPVGGCVACGGCKKEGRCVFGGSVNDALPLLKEADGYIFGSPVHYASASGSMAGFMDRLFMMGGADMRFKPAAAVASARRGGTTATLDQLQKHILYNNMMVVGSMYWTMVHGKTAEDVKQDAEGLQAMRALARNMAWVLKSLEAGKAAGLEKPQLEEKIFTSYIR